MKSTADQLCVPNQPRRTQQRAGCRAPGREQGPVLGLPEHGTAPPHPTHHRSTSARVESSVQRRQTTISLKPWVFSFSSLTLDYRDQPKPEEEEEGRLQTQHLLWRQPQPAKLSPCPPAGDLPTQGQSGIRAAANICLSALWSGVRARTRAGVGVQQGDSAPLQLREGRKQRAVLVSAESQRPPGYRVTLWGTGSRWWPRGTGTARSGGSQGMTASTGPTAG